MFHVCIYIQHVYTYTLAMLLRLTTSLPSAAMSTEHLETSHGCFNLRILSVESEGFFCLKKEATTLLRIKSGLLQGSIPPFCAKKQPTIFALGLL